MDTAEPSDAEPEMIMLSPSSMPERIAVRLPSLRPVSTLLLDADPLSATSTYFPLLSSLIADDGTVITFPAGSDARMTDAGKEFCLLAIADRYEDETAISLSPEEDRILRILLGKLVSGLDEVSERK